MSEHLRANFPHVLDNATLQHPNPSQSHLLSLFYIPTQALLIEITNLSLPSIIMTPYSSETLLGVCHQQQCQSICRNHATASINLDNNTSLLKFTPVYNLIVRSASSIPLMTMRCPHVLGSAAVSMRDDGLFLENLDQAQGDSQVELLRVESRVRDKIGRQEPCYRKE